MARQRFPCRTAFTLIELLLVIALILTVSGLAVPTLMRAYRGEQLRAAVREIAAAHRLARSLAFLRSTPMELRLHPSARRIEVHGPPAAPEAWSTETLFDAESQHETAPEEEARPATAESVRVWAEEVRLVRVEINGEPRDETASLTLPYTPGGGVPEWCVWLEDRQGERAKVRANPYTGRVEVGYERP